MACYHRLGIGRLKKDEEEALRWLEKAAANKQADALYELGLLRMKSEDQWTRATGIKWLFMAACGGHAEARLFCAREKCVKSSPVYFDTMSQSSIFGEPLDEPSGKQCVDWLQGLAQRGHAEAQFLLGKCYENGVVETYSNFGELKEETIVSEDVNEAIKLYRWAAEMGHLEAQFRLSQCYALLRYNLIVETAKSLGVDVMAARWVAWDADKRAKWHEQRDRFFRHAPDIIVLENESLKWWMLAAKRGWADAQFVLAKACDPSRQLRDNLRIYDYPPLEEEEVLEWLCKAIAQGHHGAISYLVEGKTFRMISVCRRLSDRPRVVEALEHAAEQGHFDAAYFLAVAYSSGDMGIRDCEKASEWLQKAARLGDVDYRGGTAQAVHTVQMLLEGRNIEFTRPDLSDELWLLLARCLDATVWVTPKNEVTAESYFRHAESLFDEEDRQSEAVWWYQAAALRGHAEAKKRLVEMQLKSTQAIMGVFRQID